MKQQQIKIDHQLCGKRVLLTGATGGIGQAIAAQLAAAGAHLVLVARQPEALLALSQQLPGQHSCFSADLTVNEELLALGQFVKNTGGIDVLINNAGISQFSLLATQNFQSQLALNLLAPMQLCQLLLPDLLLRPAATIVNIGSAFGSIGYPGFSGYCASKFGLRGFTEALSREVASEALRVLYFAPRATATSMNSPAVNRMNEALNNTMDLPDVVAQALMQQLKTGQRRSYLGWPEKLFVRLNALMPGLVDRAIAAKVALIRHYATAANPTTPHEPNPGHATANISATR